MFCSRGRKFARANSHAEIRVGNRGQIRALHIRVRIEVTRQHQCGTRNRIQENTILELQQGEISHRPHAPTEETHGPQLHLESVQSSSPFAAMMNVENGVI